MMSRNASSKLIAFTAGTVLSVSAASAQVLYSNCNLSTGTTTLGAGAAGLPAGSFWSECARDATDATTANTTAGFGGTGALRLADDFTIPAGGGWNVTAIRVYAYLTGATTPGITAGTLQIWNAAPPGGLVIFGDTATNRMIAGSNVFSPYYRTFNTITPPVCGGAVTVPGLTRHVQQVDLAVNMILPPGTYWVDYNYTGASFSPPATISTAIGRQCNPANSNGLQFNAAWVPLNDAGQGCAPVAVQQDMYFEVIGTPNGAATGACCLGAPTYSCLINTAAGCATAGGTYAGDNITCAAANCPPPPTGACCAANGSCSVVTQAACTTAGGIYGGDNVTCAAANCQPIGWAEVGDAGDTPTTAQEVTAAVAAPCQYITGAIQSGNADVYKICITDEANFLATTAGTTPATTIDTQLYIFNSGGFGLAMDDDDVGVTGTLQSRLTTQFVPSNGTYYLGISTFDNDPVDATAQAIWLDQNATPAYGPEWAPNGPGAANAWTAFDNVAGAAGTYKIALTGVSFCVPQVACYANCDLSTTNPVLTANDFQCFLNAYAASSPYANCDGSTNIPVLTANDFQCFLNAYAAGCS